MPIVRISILRCEPEQFARFRERMAAAEAVLAPGITAMKGCVAYYAGADEATLSLSNVSVWDTLDDARQMDRFQPMLDLAKEFAAEGARFERPILNHATLWQLPPG